MGRYMQALHHREQALALSREAGNFQGEAGALRQLETSRAAGATPGSCGHSSSAQPRTTPVSVPLATTPAGRRVVRIGTVTFPAR